MFSMSGGESEPPFMLQFLYACSHLEMKEYKDATKLFYGLLNELEKSYKGNMYSNKDLLGGDGEFNDLNKDAIQN